MVFLEIMNSNNFTCHNLITHTNSLAFCAVIIVKFNTQLVSFTHTRRTFKAFSVVGFWVCSDKQDVIQGVEERV